MINWDAIGSFIASYRATEWDKDAVAAAVDKAVNTWYEADAKAGVVFVENLIEEPFPAKMDLGLGTLTSLTVCDWKTKRAGMLDDVWTLRETRSPQRKLYAAALASQYGPDIFPVQYQVRGIKLDEHKPTTKTLASAITAGEAREALRHLQDKSAMRDTLIERTAYPWPRNEAGCRMFGPQYKCEWEGVCWENASPVPATDQDAVTRVLSHSSAKEFLRCPELYRLNRSVSRETADDDTSVAGSLFHDVMDLIYRPLVKNNS